MKIIQEQLQDFIVEILEGTVGIKQVSHEDLIRIAKKHLKIVSCKTSDKDKVEDIIDEIKKACIVEDTDELYNQIYDADYYKD